MADTIVLNPPTNVKIYTTSTKTKYFKDRNPKRIYSDNSMQVGFTTATWTKNGVSMGYGMSSYKGSDYGFDIGIPCVSQFYDDEKMMYYGYSYIGYVDKNAGASMPNYNAYKKKLRDMGSFSLLSTQQCTWSSKESTNELFDIDVADTTVGILAIGDVYYAHIAAVYLDKDGNETYSSWANSAGFTIKSSYNIYFSSNNMTLAKATSYNTVPDAIPSSRSVTYSDDANWWGYQLYNSNNLFKYAYFKVTYSGSSIDQYLDFSLYNNLYSNLNTSYKYDISDNFWSNSDAYFGDITLYLNTTKEFNIVYKKSKAATETYNSKYSLPYIDTENNNKILEGYYDSSTDKQIFPSHESYFTGTLYAKYFDENVTVTIHADEGSSVSPTKFIFGKGKPICLQKYDGVVYESFKLGYINKGLYYDTEFTRPFDTADTLNEDTTLYIKWVPDTSVCTSIISNRANIHIGNEANTAKVYVYTKGKWRFAYPNVYVGDKWYSLQQNCEWDMMDGSYGAFYFDGFKDSLDKGYVKNSFSVGDNILSSIKGNFLVGYYDTTVRLRILGFDHNKELEGNKTVHLQTYARSTSNTNTTTHYESGGGNSIGIDNKIGILLPYMTLNSLAVGWKDSYIRNTICPQFYNTIENQLKNIIVKCPKYSDNNPVCPKVADNITLTEDYVWILSMPEIGIYRTEYYKDYVNTFEEEKQKQYDYFKNGNTSDLCKFNSRNTTYYILRSPAYLSAYNPEYYFTSSGDNYGKSSSISPCLVVKYN